MADEFTDWRKSTRSVGNGACVEAGLKDARWRTSSRCSNGSCVEVGEGDGGIIGIRDSKNPDGTVLTFSARAWQQAVDRIKAA